MAVVEIGFWRNRRPRLPRAALVARQLCGVLYDLGATLVTPVTVLSDGAKGPCWLGEIASTGPTRHVLLGETLQEIAAACLHAGSEQGAMIGRTTRDHIVRNFAWTKKLRDFDALLATKVRMQQKGAEAS